MSDRLSELRRQRALLEEHLAWLDRQIIAEGRQFPAEPPQPAPPGTVPQTTPACDPKPAPAVWTPGLAPSSPGTLPATAIAPDALLDEYRVAPDSLRNDVRKGCLLYFALAFVLLTAGVAILWFALGR